MKYVLILIFLVACGNDITVGGKENNKDNPTIINGGKDDSLTLGTNPVCIGLQDVADGFLWKPVSESDGNLAIHFPSKFNDPFISVSVEALDGSLESCTFKGFGNGDRQLFRCSKSGDNYTGKVIVDSGNSECVWIVENPSERNE